MSKKRDLAAEKYDISTYILFFFCFSFIGWVWEVLLQLIQNGQLINRGVFFGPWLPIYGSGGVVILLFLRKFYKQPVVTFLLTVIVCSAIEYFTGWYLEVSKGLRWWDYSGYLINLHGRICLEGSIIFGIGGSLIIYFIAPFLNKYFKELPKDIIIISCVTLITFFSIDLLYSHFYPNTGKGITDNQETQQQRKNRS